MASNQSGTPDVDDDGGSVQLLDADGKRTVVGYVIVWGAHSSVRSDGKRHVYNRGSVTWADPTNAFWHHQASAPIGSTANGTLRINEDDHGVKVEIDLDPETTIGRDVYQYVKSRLAQGMSFGGTRYASKPTNDPTVIEVTRFVANDVTITVTPSMTETQVVTADNSEQLSKERALARAKTKLDSYKLTALKLGRVSR